MNTKLISQYRHLIVRIIIVPVTLFLISNGNLRAQSIDKNIKIGNPKCTITGDVLTITYDLLAPPISRYTVHIVVLRAHDPAFRFTPEAVVGDIGDGVTAGPNKEIRWSYYGDLPQGLPADNYSCEFYVERVTSTTWLYYVLGGVAAAGAALLLLLGKSSHPGPDNQPVSLPPPPTRPG